jgi:hypothetical protein
MRADLTLKQKRGLMHDRFVLLKREREPELAEMGFGVPDEAINELFYDWGLTVRGNRVL